MSSATTTTNALVQTTGRPHPERLHPGMYPLMGATQARYADMDANAHLNNLALESLHEDARAVLNARAFPGIYSPQDRQLRLVTSQNAVHFLGEAHWPAVLDTGVGVGRIGRTSFVASSALFRDGVCISVCDTVLVALGAEGPVPIPASAREILQGLQLRIS
ncbi:acyl-CoA thioesterase [Rhodococcus aetherivorans]|uniref:acyl-CoA thioesterase n=1 Tax=Rhodococcus aetherivorans TaxID=191292 RepID=UPI00241E75F5|nr:acyl-CoA thioesterase [Rhodococcus aetherivorans]WFS11031.1 acyl-CoA thioesterase [Rhodococcus aetherivorans]